MYTYVNKVSNAIHAPAKQTGVFPREKKAADNETTAMIYNIYDGYTTMASFTGI